MQGEHPEHRGVRDPRQLAMVERYFVEVLDIPCLQARVECFLFHRQFASNAQRVIGCMQQQCLCWRYCLKSVQPSSLS